MRYITIILFSFLIPLLSNSQVKKIRVALSASPVYNSEISNTEYSFFNDTLLNSYKGIPKNSLCISVKIYYTNYSNYLFWLYQTRQISAAMFKYGSELYKIKQKDFKRETNFKIAILCGIDSLGHRYFVVDKNSNNDFGDEEMLNKNEFYSNNSFKVRNLESVIRGKVTNGSIWILPVPSGSTILGNDCTKWNLKVRISNQLSGSILSNGTLMKVYVSSSFYLNAFEYPSKKSDIFLVNDTSCYAEQTEMVPYLVHDTIFRDDGYWILDSLDFSGKFLQGRFIKRKNTVKYGFNTNYYLPKYKILNQMTKKDIDITSLKGKYLFIDFGGSWCVPCREISPLIRSFYDSLMQTPFKDSITFINISVENRESYNQDSEIILKNSPNWINILQYFGDNRNFSTIMHINDGYPTLFLISPESKIIKRVTGKDKFDSFKKTVVEYLNKGAYNHMY